MFGVLRERSTAFGRALRAMGYCKIPARRFIAITPTPWRRSKNVPIHLDEIQQRSGRPIEGCCQEFAIGRQWFKDYGGRADRPKEHDYQTPLGTVDGKARYPPPCNPRSKWAYIFGAICPWRAVGAVSVRAR